MTFKVAKKKSSFLANHNKSRLDKLDVVSKQTLGMWSKTYYKEYPRFPRIELPVFEDKDVNFFEVLSKRRSSRKFSSREITVSELSKLLYYGAGIQQVGEKNGSTSRYYPSAGARYPLEVYVFAKNVRGIEKGVYHYNIKLHALELLRGEDFSEELEGIGGEVNKQVLEECSFFIIVTAVFGRAEIKYGKTAYKLVLLEAGHLGQNIGLVSASLNIGSCFLGGYVDKKVNKLLELNEDKEQSIFLMACGDLNIK